MRVFQSVPVPIRGARLAYEPWFPLMLMLIIFVAVMIKGAP